MEKTINSIRFVPLSEMTEEDWNILDWDFLRNKAKNRIAAAVVAGTLRGFYHVNVLMKARAKPDYYWPAEFDDPMLDSDTADFFRHEADDEFESNDVENIDQMILELSLLDNPRELRLFERMMARISAGEFAVLAEDRKWWAEWLDWLRMGRPLPSWIYLALAIYLYRWLGILSFDKLMEQIDKEFNGRS